MDHFTITTVYHQRLLRVLNGILELGFIYMPHTLGFMAHLIWCAPNSHI